VAQDGGVGAEDKGSDGAAEHVRDTAHDVKPAVVPDESTPRAADTSAIELVDGVSVDEIKPPPVTDGPEVTQAPLLEAQPAQLPQLTAEQLASVDGASILESVLGEQPPEIEK